MRLLISMWLVGQVAGAVRVGTDGRDVDQAICGAEDGRDMVASTTLHPQSHSVVSTVWQSCPCGFGQVTALGVGGFRFGHGAQL